MLAPNTPAPITPRAPIPSPSTGSFAGRLSTCESVGCCPGGIKRPINVRPRGPCCCCNNSSNVCCMLIELSQPVPFCCYCLFGGKQIFIGALVLRLEPTSLV